MTREQTAKRQFGVTSGSKSKPRRKKMEQTEQIIQAVKQLSAIIESVYGVIPADADWLAFEAMRFVNQEAKKSGILMQ